MSILSIIRGMSIDSLQTPNLYHYRNLNDVYQILQPNRIVLWAGHVDQMNDDKEFKTGLNVIKSNPLLDRAFHKTIEFTLKNRFPYQLSLSLANDSEYMWKNYGNNAGAMLILDSTIIRSCYPNTAKCIYDNTPEFDQIRELILSDTWLVTPNDFPKAVPSSEDIWDYLTQFVYLAKNSRFQKEEEVRIFGEQSCNVIKKGNRTFIEIVFPKKVLKGIVIGPCTESEFESTKRKILDMLFHNGYNHLVSYSVKKSMVRL